MFNETIKATVKDAARKLTGHRKRDFMAKVAEDYFGGSARKTETFLGWNRDNIASLVDVQAQADPKFQSTFLSARISARSVREVLMNEKGYDEEQLPSRQTIGAILNRMGYRLKKHKKLNH